MNKIASVVLLTFSLSLSANGGEIITDEAIAKPFIMITGFNR